MKILLILALGIISSVAQTKTAQSIQFSDNKDTKKVLFIAGRPSHSHGQHEHRAGSMLLANALNKANINIEAQVHWYGWPKDESIFDKADLTVIYADAGGRMSEGVQKLLDERVGKGMGIMFIHYGVHPSPAIGEKYFLNWTGGYYKSGTSVNPHWIAHITPKENHPVANGISSAFKAFDEFYYNIVRNQDCKHCLDLATAIPKPENILRYNNHWSKKGDNCFGTRQALMWARDPQDGAGRGVGWVGGHFHSNWAMDEFRTLTLNAIAWAARVEVPSGGVPSATPTIGELNENLDKGNRAPFRILPPSKDIFERESSPRPDLETARYKNLQLNKLLSPMWKKGDPVNPEKRKKPKK